MALKATLGHGVLRLPGITPETTTTVNRLLEQDVTHNHCFHGPGFHNHLPHHLLAIYDLGASSELLRKAYDRDIGSLHPLKIDGSERIPKITQENWTTELGNAKAYHAYLAFFNAEVASRGAAAAFDAFVLQRAANSNGARMLARLVADAFHPLIQVGYGFEFGDDRLVASGLAQTAVHKARDPEMFADIFDAAPAADRKEGPTVFELLRAYYGSPTMVPVMPYDPNALLTKRYEDAFRGSARGAEIARLARLWRLPADAPAPFWQARVDELLWALVLLLTATGRPGRAPRLDFFIMHMVTSVLFLPSLFARAIPRGADRAALLQAYVRVALAVLTIRGRPRINGALIMGATATPAPPNNAPPAGGNPWGPIIASAAHFPEAHVAMTIRTLVLGAQRLGATPAGGVPGALGSGGVEVLPGLAKVDGSLFIRAAGVVMNALGWTDYGQPERHWDHSALGWDAAWDNKD